MVTPLPPDWRGFFEALLAAHVEFVVIGALAVAAHAEPRFTEDLDVLVRPVRSNGVRLRRADILTGISGVTWDEAYRGRILVDVDGLVLRVIGRKELVANKRASGRPKDLLDLEMLARTAPRMAANRTKRLPRRDK